MADANESEQSELPVPDSEQLELKLPDESAAPKDLALWAGVLALLTLIAFWPATTGSFVWRDDVRVASNKDLLIAPSGLSQSWFGRWQSAGKFNEPIYQPVTDTAYWLEYRLGGHNEHGLPTSTSFHIAGLIFEAAAAILLWLILRELLIPGAWLVAAIFAVHPIHAEPVSWISEQGTVLSGMLFLGSVYCYLMFVKSREQDAADRAAGGAGVDPAQTWGLFGGAAVIGLMAMLSQPSALVIPAVIALLLWWKKRYVSQDGLLLLPLLVIGLALWFSDFDLHKTTGQTLLRQPLMQKITAVGHAFWCLSFHLIVPLRFSVLYLRGDQSSLFAVFAALSFVVLAGLYVFKSRFGTGILVAAAIVVMLVCFSVNWFDLSRLAYVTDGALYLATIPLLALIVLVISRFKLPGPQPQTIVGICTVILIVLGGLTLHRTYAFENPVAFWRDVLKKDATSSLAEASLAEQLRLLATDDAQQDDKEARDKDWAESKQHAESALRLDPMNGQAQRTWANVLVSEGDIAQALPHFVSAAQLEPNNAKLRDEYGTALLALGRYKEAKLPLDEAIALDVMSSEPHRLLGDAYAGLGDTQRAIREETTAMELDPGDLVARQKLAEFEAKTGQFKDAISNYVYLMQADKAQMNNPDVWRAMAKIKDQEGQYEMAAEYLQAAQKLAPDDAAVKKELDIETTKATHAAATRAATMPATTRP